MCQIKKIYQTELEYLKDGIKNSVNPYHTFTLSSINGVHPESRTIVLRGLDLDPLRIYFNADYRSPKVEQLLSNPFCSALFYDSKRRIQLRFKCRSVVHNQNDISSGIWRHTALQSRKCYMGPHSPSKVLDEWHPNIPLEYLKTDPDKDHSNEGYVNFTYIELEIIESDLLQLHHDGHIRFKVESENKLFFVSP
jgi:pyridoxamine 5'-phosphate oxidase|tara:strand:- start:1087 stop:1668 length:582 start_codon:yes stop_codon:yes gene_type:complete